MFLDDTEPDARVVLILALQVLSDSVEKLQLADNDLALDEQELASFYLGRIADLQSFFRFAQMALETVLGSDSSLDFEAVSKIEIG